MSPLVSLPHHSAFFEQVTSFFLEGDFVLTWRRLTSRSLDTICLASISNHAIQWHSELVNQMGCSIVHLSNSLSNMTMQRKGSFSSGV